MTDKEAVKDALEQLSEEASLEQIVEEVHLLIAIKRGRADVATGRTRPHEEVEKLLASWATAWTSK